MRGWLDNWSGIGLIIAGMTYQGRDVQLTAYAARDGRANFFHVGIAHSIGGPAWEPTAWRAVQRAAWEVLRAGASQLVLFRRARRFTCWRRSLSDQPGAQWVEIFQSAPRK